jgi:hypothetical protein
MTPNNSTCVKNTCDFSIKLSIKTNVLSVSIYNNTIYPKFMHTDCVKNRSLD